MPANISPIERAKINKKLKQNGFGGLDDPNLFAQIGTLYRTHESFRGLLMSTHPDQRRIAYESIRPHLCFVAKPLDVYEREIKEKAEREQWDVWNGTPFPERFQVGEIETDEYKLARQAQDAIEDAKHEKAGGVLELVCTKCTVFEHFPAAKRKDALKRAYKLGWRWSETNGTKRTFCPKHVPGRLTLTVICAGCTEEKKFRAWDEHDARERARLAGWALGDYATCPSCTLHPPTIQ